MMFPRALLLSLLIHTLLSLLFTGGKGNGDGEGEKEGQQQQNINVKIIEKPAEEDKEALPPPPENKSKIKILKKKQEAEKKKAPPVECKEWYGGIGINQDFFDQVVIVHPGYPAHKAGLKSGDKILSPKMANIRGEPGTEVVLLVQRNGQILTFYIIRDKICTDKLNKEQP